MRLPSMYVVAVISARARSTLVAADVGIGIPDQSGILPWARTRCCPVWPSATRLLVRQRLRKLQLSAANQGGDLGLIPPRTQTITPRL
jgi:hypothetical protein